MWNWDKFRILVRKEDNQATVWFQDSVRWKFGKKNLPIRRSRSGNVCQHALGNQVEDSIQYMSSVKYDSSACSIQYGECCKSAGVSVAFTSSQRVIECCKSVSVAVAFTRLVDGVSALLGRRKNSSTHQFGCSSDDMEIDGLDFRIT